MVKGFPVSRCFRSILFSDLSYEIISSPVFLAPCTFLTTGTPGYACLELCVQGRRL